MNSSETEGVPSTAIREISLLKDLCHPAIVQLFDVVIEPTDLFMVFEFIDMDLKHYMDRHKASFPPALIKVSFFFFISQLILNSNILQSYMYQLLDGIAYCHSKRVLHRDLKPQNLLVDSEGHIKVADFGLARAFTLPMRGYTHEVITLWYRAPEILLGTKFYATGVDIWGLGCICAELVITLPPIRCNKYQLLYLFQILKRPLFAGDTEVNQLHQIFKTMGTPTEKVWPGVTHLPDYNVGFPMWQRQPFSNALAKHEAYPLVKSILVYDPAERVSARDAMKHPYFNDHKIVVPSFWPPEKIEVPESDNDE